MVTRNEEVISSLTEDFAFEENDHVVIFGETEKLMEYKSNTKRINYWSSRIPQIVEKAGVKK